jgi:hypothetical protein
VEDSCTAGAPAADDQSCDNLDDDCDGQVDEDFVAAACTPLASGCTVGALTCGSGTQTCRPVAACAEDPDHDGICASGASHPGICTTGPDNCPALANVDQANLDGDISGDACDLDVDDDGICNPGASGAGCTGSDNCPRVRNANQGNQDGDSLGDVCDDDADGDGVCNAAVTVAGVCTLGPDRAPFVPTQCSDRDNDGCDDCLVGSAAPLNDGPDLDRDGICDAGEDTDGDGVLDVVDLDDDNDGVPDALETARTGDQDQDDEGDGVPNRIDLDSDNDGLADLYEAGLDAFDAELSGFVTGALGTNGLLDALERNADSGQYTHVLIDSDGDGTRDMFDLDSDADGVFDVLEVDALAALDADGDGMIDDTRDVDGDGIRAAADHDDRFGMPRSEPAETDRDGDGIPRAYDPLDDGPTSGDSDADGASDERECPSGRPCPDADGDGRPEYYSGDTDGDGSQNVEDHDDDSDGILDSVEDAYGTGDVDGDGIPNRLDLDSDGDGVSDVDEARVSTLDLNRDGKVDGPSDATGVPRAARERGIVTPPIDTDLDGVPDFVDLDSDGDGLKDAVEADATKAPDSDGDGAHDYRDSDDDDDTVLTRDERPDPNASGLPEDAVDSDRDGSPDYLDSDDDDDGLSTRLEVVAERALSTSADSDGIPAHLDDDSDGDNISDRQEGEVDEDGNGTPDFLQARTTTPEEDADRDGLLDRDECPSEPCLDSNADGTPDYLDPDDDGDGVPTSRELGHGDSDGDDTPDYLDPDDDGDGVLTKLERPNDQDIDTDEDETPDYLDPDDDGDGIPSAHELGDADGNGTVDYLEPPERGRLSGGALCSLDSSIHGRDSAALLSTLLSALALAARRKRRGL